MKKKTLVYSLASDDALRSWVRLWFADPAGQRPSRLHALLAIEVWDQEPIWYFDADYQSADWRADPLVLTINGYRSPWGEWSEVGTISFTSEGRGERRRGLIELAYQDDEEGVRNYFEEFDKHIRMHWIGTIREKWEVDFDERIARIPPRPPLQRPSPPPAQSVKAAEKQPAPPPRKKATKQGRGSYVGTLDRVKEFHRLRVAGKTLREARRGSGCDERTYYQYCEQETGEEPITRRANRRNVGNSVKRTNSDNSMLD